MQASTKAFFTDCAFDPLRGAIVMTGHNGDVLRSTDGGRTWEGSEISIDGQKNYLSAIRFDANSSSLIAVGQGGTIARSTDGGAQWSKVSDEMVGDVRGVIDDTPRGRLFAFGTGGMILVSKDSGVHWNTARGLMRCVFARNRRQCERWGSHCHRQARSRDSLRRWRRYLEGAVSALSESQHSTGSARTRVVTVR